MVFPDEGGVNVSRRRSVAMRLKQQGERRSFKYEIHKKPLNEVIETQML